MPNYYHTAYRLSLARLLDGLYGLAFPFWTILWKDVGLSHTLAMFTQFTFGVIWVVLELPTGFFADRFGRRLSILLGMSLKALGHLVYLNAQSPFTVFIAEILLACGFSFVSGALVALMYDSLKAVDKVQEFKKLNAIGEIGNFAVAALATLFSSSIGIYGARYAIGSLVIADLLQILLVLPIIEAPHLNSQRPKLFTALSQIKTQLYTSMRFRVLIFAPPVLVAIAHGTTWFTEPYLTHVGFKTSELGLCFAGFLSVSSLITLFVRKQMVLKSEKLTLTMIPSINLAGSSIAALFLSKFGAVSFISFFTVRSITPILFAEPLNKEIPSEIRATTLSFQNLLNRLLVSTAMLICGVVADNSSIRGVFVWTSFLSALVLLAGIFIQRKVYREEF